MNNLIAVNYEGEQPSVSGRELHKALGIKEKYPDWFKRMCEYGFTENEDFYSNVSESNFSENSEKPKSGRPSVDHALTIPMAKELCMLQRNDKGKQFRQYFIKVEEAWNSPEMVMKRALEFANRKVEELTAQITADKPKVLFAEAVETAKTSINVGDLAKLLKQNGVEIGQNRLFKQLRAEGYLMKGGASHNLPTQRSMEMGLFEIMEWVLNKPDGTTTLRHTTKVTGKGQTYFINKFVGAI